MRWWGYLPLAFLAFVAAHVGGGVYAGVRVGGETPQAALADYLSNVSLAGELYLFLPFLAMGTLCGWFATQARTRSVLSIFVVALLALGYLYFDGHRSAEMAMRDARWTAAALTIGFLPFMAVPVALAAAVLGMLATRFDAREA